mmetsp:Transcript_28164/g.64432  ORF Transcript_28164/g.64432 Transcript_28164/m.64432 type:complete len:239 (+) Transcript_28164:356-1072(+)
MGLHILIGAGPKVSAVKLAAAVLLHHKVGPFLLLHGDGVGISVSLHVDEVHAGLDPIVGRSVNAELVFSRAEVVPGKERVVEPSVDGVPDAIDVVVGIVVVVPVVGSQGNLVHPAQVVLDLDGSVNVEGDLGVGAVFGAGVPQGFVGAVAKDEVAVVLHHQIRTFVVGVLDHLVPSDVAVDEGSVFVDAELVDAVAHVAVAGEDVLGVQLVQVAGTAKARQTVVTLLVRKCTPSAERE